MKSLDGQDSLARQKKLMQLINAGRAVHAALDTVDVRVAERLGLHRNDLRGLNLLEHGPLSAMDLGAGLDLTSGAVTALIDRLERAGFVQRQRSSLDRRSVQVHLKPEAFSRIALLYRDVAAAVLEQFEGADLGQLEAAIEALNTFAAGNQVALKRWNSVVKPEGVGAITGVKNIKPMAG
jgi:DNA-binding MarR family transcriptional regulator